VRDAYRQHCQTLLRKGDWFNSIPTDLQGIVLDNSKLRNFEAGEVLIMEESEPTGLYATLEGQVAISRRVNSDREFFYHLGGPGFWFGESGVLNRKITLVTVTARTAVRTLFLPVQKFNEVVNNDPEYFRWFADLQSARYALILRNVAEITGLSTEGYLRVRLADISDSLRSEAGEDGVVELALSQTDIAHMVGASRQTINVLLKKFEKEGLIDRSFRNIRIIDPAALRGKQRYSGL